jgi:hypothetical protein
MVRTGGSIYGWPVLRRRTRIIPLVAKRAGTQASWIPASERVRESPEPWSQLGYVLRDASRVLPRRLLSMRFSLMPSKAYLMLRSDLSKSRLEARTAVLQPFLSGLQILSHAVPRERAIWEPRLPC